MTDEAIVQAARALMAKIGPQGAATRLDLRHLAQAVFGTAAAFGEDDPDERIKQEIYADRHGFFWLPCPRCGRMFGGHEEPRGGSHWSGTWTSQICCPQCPGDSGEMPPPELPVPAISVSLEGGPNRNR